MKLYVDVYYMSPYLAMTTMTTQVMGYRVF
jgi:hypothetical protein